MPESLRFPFVEIDPTLGAASALPYRRVATINRATANAAA
jgi:hypothetical protein